MPLSSPIQAPSNLVAPGAVAAPTHRLTGEQQAIQDAVHDGHGKVVAEALAGTGKTSTLVSIAHSFPRRPGLYLAFNKTVQREAEARFPIWMHASTAHGLAYQALGQRYGHRLPGNRAASRMGAQTMARIMKVKPALLDTGTVNPAALTRMAQATVNSFMKTADDQIMPRHIPSRVYAHHQPNEVAEAILPVANQIWADLTSLEGKFRFTHDVYLKMWQLTNPTLHYDYLMFDEAQDADPVIAAIVDRQQMQRIWVGDRNQAIYGWRGAIDAMSRIKDAVRLPLTQSFRFGPAIAEAANSWLAMLGSDHKVVGFDKVPSTVGEVAEPRAILCRGNGTALGWILKFHADGVPVAMAPGDRNAGKEFERFAWAAKDLMNGEGTDHPDLVGFTTWDELVKHVEEEEDTDDLKRLVGIINRIGVSGVIDAVRGLVTEDRARVTVSTAHKAKGMEWDTVRVADDFVPPEPADDGSPQEPDWEAFMLNYVTVTRAKLRLEPGALGEPELWN
jgi:hypothetical protein